MIRPTGLMDPKITVRPAGDQVDDLLAEIRARAEREERVLVTTLTKRMAEDLTEYYQQLGLRVRYLHSDIDTLDRVALIRDLRLGKFDALIGINLLREGLDIPEVSLVAILDADKEGYLRSSTSLIQTSGRAARNVNGEVIMYADKVTDSMAEALARDRAAPRDPGPLQHRARDHAGIDQVEHPRAAPDRVRARLLHGGGRGAHPRDVRLARRAGQAHRRDGSRHARRRPPPRLRTRRRAPRPRPRPRSASR